MNLILLGPEDLRDDGTAEIDGRRARHVRTVLRAAVGDELRIGLIGGRRGYGRVLSLREGETIELEPRWLNDEEPVPSIDLILAMPRPKALARVLQTSACMGVRRIDIVNAWRVDKSYLSTPQLDSETVRHNLLLGCEQGGTTWVPDVAIHHLLMPFMRGALCERVSAGQSLRVIAHPRNARPLEQVVRPGDARPVVAAVGPERGWIDRELSSFGELGFHPVQLDSRVLRCEIAVAAMLAQLALLRRLPSHI